MKTTCPISKLEKLKQKQAEDLQKAINECEVKTAIRAAMPWIKDVSVHAYEADCYVKIEAETLVDAICMCEQDNPLRQYRYKDGSLSFLSETSKKVQEPKESATVELICPYRYSIDGLRQYAEKKRLVWYVKKAGYVVEVRCEVKHDPDTYRDYCITFNRYGNATKHKDNIVNRSGYFPESSRFWSTPDQPSHFVLWSY